MTDTTPLLFSPYVIRGMSLRNRLVLAPMMQYRARDGFASDWHLVHFGKFALGGFALVMTEVVAVTKEGRISYGDLGLWSDEHISGLRRCADFVHGEGALAAIQLGHAGRKASVKRVWEGGSPITAQNASPGEAAWPVVGPSALAVSEQYQTPHALTVAQIQQLVEDFAMAARRARLAGFDVVEIHGAHGYLIASFLSPVSNQREDEYGGDRAGRMRFALEVVDAVRSEWPSDRPLFFRISAEDGAGAGGWGMDDSLALATELALRGVDVVDCSSGGITGAATLGNSIKGPGYQVPYADQIKNSVKIPTMAVGLVLTPEQAQSIVESGQADLVAIGRQALYDPFWPLHARQALQSDPQFQGWDESSGFWLRKRALALEQLGLPLTGQ